MQRKDNLESRHRMQVIGSPTNTPCTNEFDCRSTWIVTFVLYRWFSQMPGRFKPFGVLLFAGTPKGCRQVQASVASLKPLTQAYCSSHVSGLCYMTLLHIVVGSI